MQNHTTTKFLSISAAYLGLPADQNGSRSGQSND
ncbi:MAG: hypothetical protein H6R16_1166 [Proteobacteria bacterium]|nr:hypothetical protein [Pseudomonadota bacterium]